MLRLLLKVAKIHAQLLGTARKARELHRRPIHGARSILAGLREPAVRRDPLVTLGPAAHQ